MEAKLGEEEPKSTIVPDSDEQRHTAIVLAFIGSRSDSLTSSSSTFSGERRQGSTTLPRVAHEPSSIVVDTPIGIFGVTATAVGVSRIRLPGSRLDPESIGDGAATARSAAAQIGEYMGGEREEFDIPLDWREVGVEHRKVLETLCAIAPYGHTVTYGELGTRAGVEDPREIGMHMATNPLPIVVPCHRVVAADGLGGYGGGVELKRRLLELEGALPPSLDLGSL